MVGEALGGQLIHGLGPVGQADDLLDFAVGQMHDHQVRPTVRRADQGQLIAVRRECFVQVPVGAADPLVEDSGRERPIRIGNPDPAVAFEQDVGAIGVQGGWSGDGRGLWQGRGGGFNGGRCCAHLRRLGRQCLWNACRHLGCRAAGEEQDRQGGHPSEESMLHLSSHQLSVPDGTSETARS